MNVFAWNLFNCFSQVSVFYILYSVYGYKISPEETLPLCHVCLATWSLVTDCRNAHRLQQLDMQPYWLLFRDMYQLWCVASDMPSFFSCQILFEIQDLHTWGYKNLFLGRYPLHMDQKGWISWGSLRKWRKWKPVN